MITTRRGFVKLATMAAMGAVGAAVPSAFASSSAPDYSAKGSITIDMIDTSTKKSVPGGTLALYTVAAAVDDGGDAVFELTGDFADSGATIDADALSENGAHALASDLAAYVEAHALAGSAAAVPSTGRVRFDDLPLGLYLVVQTDPAEGYEPLAPFCVTVPMRDGDEYIYDVVANPKPGTVTAKPPTPVNPPNPSTPVTPTLPQTGQLWWPVPLLAAAGVTMLVAGGVGKAHAASGRTPRGEAALRVM